MGDDRTLVNELTGRRREAEAADLSAASIDLEARNRYLAKLRETGAKPFEAREVEMLITLTKEQEAHKGGYVPVREHGERRMTIGTTQSTLVIPGEYATALRVKYIEPTSELKGILSIELSYGDPIRALTAVGMQYQGTEEELARGAAREFLKRAGNMTVDQDS